MSQKVIIEATEKLDDETLAALDLGIATAENGRLWTAGEAFEIARSRRKEWISPTADQTES